MFETGIGGSGITHGGGGAGGGGGGGGDILRSPVGTELGLGLGLGLDSAYRKQHLESRGMSEESSGADATMRNKHIMLLRDALGRMSLRDKCALSMSVWDDDKQQQQQQEQQHQFGRDHDATGMSIAYWVIADHCPLF
jgi:hypothetical protein